MKNILIPTDFSDAANNAFLYALRLANQLDVQLYVLYSYVTPILSSTHAGQPELLAEVYQQVELSKFEYFKKQAPFLHQLATDNGLNHSKIAFLFESGPVLSSVKSVLAKEEIGLVVMGTHGASGITKDIIGTNTVDIIRNTKVPVLAIPTEAPYKTIQKAAFTTMFREKDLAALEEFIRLAKLVDAQVYCIHVMDDSTDPSNALLYADDWGKKFSNEKVEFILLEKSGNIESTINYFIADNQIDILGIVRRNRGFFDRLINSSLSNKFAFHSQTPILVFHESTS